jgi:hypothetical protein
MLDAGTCGNCLPLLCDSQNCSIDKCYVAGYVLPPNMLSTVAGAGLFRVGQLVAISGFGKFKLLLGGEQGADLNIQFGEQ